MLGSGSVWVPLQHGNHRSVTDQGVPNHERQEHEAKGKTLYKSAMPTKSHQQMHVAFYGWILEHFRLYDWS